MTTLNAKRLIFSDSARQALKQFYKLPKGLTNQLSPWEIHCYTEILSLCPDSAHQALKQFYKLPKGLTNQLSPWEIHCYAEILSLCPEIVNRSRKTNQNLPKTFYISSLTFVSVPEEVLKTNVSTLEALNTCKI